MSKEVMSRDDYCKIIEIIDDVCEEDTGVLGFTERHSIGDYILNYEYDGDGVYFFDLMDEDMDILFSSEGNLEYSQEEFKQELHERFFDMTRELLKVGNAFIIIISKPGINGHIMEIGDMVKVKYKKTIKYHYFDIIGLETNILHKRNFGGDFVLASQRTLADLDAMGAFDQDTSGPSNDEGSAIAVVAQELQGGDDHE